MRSYTKRENSSVRLSERIRYCVTTAKHLVDIFHFPPKVSTIVLFFLELDVDRSLRKPRVRINLGTLSMTELLDLWCYKHSFAEFSK